MSEHEILDFVGLLKKNRELGNSTGFQGEFLVFASGDAPQPLENDSPGSGDEL